MLADPTIARVEGRIYVIQRVPSLLTSDTVNYVETLKVRLNCTDGRILSMSSVTTLMTSHNTEGSIETSKLKEFYKNDDKLHASWQQNCKAIAKEAKAETNGISLAWPNGFRQQATYIFLARSSCVFAQQASVLLEVSV
jgi:hypothetical protein